MAMSSYRTRLQRPSAISALEAGLTGVVVMSLFVYLVAPALHLPVVDLTLLGSVGTVAPTGVDFLFAVLRLWPVGVAAGFVYAYGVAPLLSWSGWFKGLIFGLASFLLLSVVAMPLAGLFHPNVTGGLVPRPGWFGLGLGGWLVPIALLGDHLIFGTVLGAIYRPGPRATIELREREGSSDDYGS